MCDLFCTEFHQGKGSRSISFNSHYLVLFKNPRDKLQILTLAKQMYPGQTAFFINQYEEAVKTLWLSPGGLKKNTQDNCRLRTNVLPGEEQFNQTGIQDNISPELLKYVRQQNLSTAPALPAMQQLQDSMDGRTDLGEYDKAKQYLKLQNRYLTFKHQFTARPQQSHEIKRSFASHPEDNLPTIKQEPTAATAVTTSTPLNPFITTPSLNLALTKQEPTTPLPLNPFVLTPPPTVQTPSPAPKRKRLRIQFVNYLDTDDDKPKRRSRRYRYKAEPYKYSKHQED